MSDKPLGQRAYGHIPHLIGSRMGPADKHCHKGQARIATATVRDKHDKVYVQEKLDGSCVAVAKVNGEIVPLGRAGYRAITSPFHQHVLFHDWALAQSKRFDDLLEEGERVVGEWLAQAHGTRYDLSQTEPFVAFDIMRGTERATLDEVSERWDGYIPSTVRGPLSIEEAAEWFGTYGHYHAIDPIEGYVWRVERRGAVDFLVKYVRPDKVDGSYLDSVTGQEPVWNWQPAAEAAA